MFVSDMLKLETEIPLKQVVDFQFQWCLDEHAVLTMTGILDAGQVKNAVSRDYKGTKIIAEYEEIIIFCGFTTETIVHVSGDLYQIEVKAFSATEILDRDLHNEMFQEVSLTYAQMMDQMVSRQSGEVICMVGDRSIGNPLLCYKETIWQYAKRMTSHFHSHVIPDVKTGRPAFWFGMGGGRKVANHDLFCDQIEIRKSVQKKQKDRTTYSLTGRQDYQLCDRISVDNDWFTIYQKNVCLERGEIIFHYLAAREESLHDVSSYYQEDITGLNLKGTVEKVKDEQVYVRLDLDGKPGTYPFPWFPETGTCLYAMPEIGAKVELYFMGSDEKEVIAVRCRDTGEADCDEKRIELPDGAKISMSTSRLSLEKGSRINLTDHNIEISGAKAIEISAVKRVKLSAKIVEVNAADTISYVTEW